MMKDTKLSQLIIVLTVLFGNVGLTSAVYAQARASESDELRYVKAMVEYLYESDRNEDVTVQGMLDDGYKMCEKIADQGGWENLAQDAIRSGLGIGGEQPQDDDREMARLADKYLCDS